MNEKILRTVLRMFITEMYKKPRKSDALPFPTQLSASKPDTNRRQELVSKLLSDDDTMQMILPIVCDFAHIPESNVKDYLEADRRWNEWIDQHGDEIQSSPTDWPDDGLNIRTQAGKRQTHLMTLLWSAQLKGVDKEISSALTAEQPDWRPDIPIPEDYYAL